MSSQKAKPALSFHQLNSIAIVYRPDTDLALALSQKLIALLKKRKFSVYTAPQQKLLPGTHFIKKNQMANLKLVIVLGGDGTYLRAVRFLNGQQVPILGVHLGSLGFLTETRAEDLFEALELILKNKMTPLPRSMIEASIYRKGKRVDNFIGLNDIVLERGDLSHLINIELFSENHFVSNIKADGIIVSTPTGSTAYNLAAGGPILHPQVKAFVVTAIAPHSLYSRPIIFSDEGDLIFKIKGAGEKVRLVVDGRHRKIVTEQDEIVIRRSPKDHIILRHPKDDFFSIFRNKLNFGDRK